MRVTPFILRSLGEWKDAIRSLDQFVREVTAVLNGGVRLRDQLAAEIKTFQYTSGTILPVQTRLSSKPLTVIALSAVESSGAAYTLSGGLVHWDWNNGVASIMDVAGLSINTEYVVTLAFVEG